MSVIIRLQNLPWSANALDIRNFFRGLSIPEGGVHIVGGELGDAFIAFSTDEDARQAMMLDGGKIKEIQVKLYLSSRSEMHKVIEAARQSVPILALAPVAPAIASPTPAALTVLPTAVTVNAPIVSPFSTALGNNLGFGIPGIGNPQEIPQPAVIEAPVFLSSPPLVVTPEETEKDEDKLERKRSKEKDRRRSRSKSRSRDRERKDRKRDRRDRSRSRDKRRRDRSRSRERRDRKRDRKDRSRSRERSPSRRSRDRRNERKSPPNPQPFDIPIPDALAPPPPSFSTNPVPQIPQIPNNPMLPHPMMPNGPMNQIDPLPNRFNDPSMAETFNKLQELGKKRNPNAFQGEMQNGAGRIHGGRGDGNMMRGGGSGFRKEARSGRFDNEQQPRDCCVAIRNAPNHTSYGDVRRFFPFMIDKHGIKMINDNMGRRTGNIFVRFCDSRSKHLSLQRKHNMLKGAEVAVEHLEDETYETAVDSFLPFREENEQEEEEQNVIVPEVEKPRPVFSVLKLTDLPNFVKEHDIIKLFSDFSLLSIMLNDCRITRSKIAFVQFVNPDDAKKAMERKDRYLFGRRHPVIVPITDEDYKIEKSKSEKIPDPRIQQEEQMEPPPMEGREPAIPRDPRQRRQQFENGAQGNQPQLQQSTPFFAPQFVQGQPFVAPFPSPQFGSFPGNALDPRTAAANWANRPPFPNNQIAAPLNKNPVIDLDDEPLDCVLMKGLPRDATDRTIVTFLSETGAVPARIHLMLDTNGMPSGDCFCEFRSTQEARMAATKHGHDLDGCRVTVDLVTRVVVEEALEGPKQPETRDGLLGNGPPQQSQFFDNHRGGFQPRGTFRGRGGFERGFDRGNFRGGFESGRGGFDSGRGGFDSVRGGFDSGRGSFDSGRSGFDSGRGGFDSGRGGFDSGRGGFDSGRGGFDSGRGGFDSGRGGFRGRGTFVDRGRFDRGRGRGFSRGRGGFDNGHERDLPMRDDVEQDSALDDFGAPGCVVSMENVPFRASVDDMMEFFSEFELTQDDIIRRYNERGQPTGDARVAFRTPFDAQRAIKTRHLDTIQDRRIHLTIL